MIGSTGWSGDKISCRPHRQRLGAPSWVLSGLLAASLLAGNSEAQLAKRFFFGPSPAPGIEEYVKTFTDLEGWDWLATQSHAFDLHINSLGPNPNDPAFLQDDELKAMIDMIDHTGLEVALIVGGLRVGDIHEDPATWPKMGEGRAFKDDKGLKRFLDMGGHIDQFLVDGAFREVTINLGMSWEQAAGELSDYLDIIRRRAPEAKLTLIEPLPSYHLGELVSLNWPITQGDVSDLFDTVFPILGDRGHRFEAFLADSPINFTKATPFGFEKIVGVEHLTHSWGLRFGLFLTDEIGGFDSSKLFYENCLEGLMMLREAGGSPDDFNLRTWFTQPDKVVPEEEIYTHAWTSGQLARQVFAQFPHRAPGTSTVTFDDKTLGDLRWVNGDFDVRKGGLEVYGNAEFQLQRQVYSHPNMALGMDFKGMQPGTTATIVLDSVIGDIDYHLTVEALLQGRSRVVLESVNKGLGTKQVLAKGAAVDVDVLNEAFTVLVRTPASHVVVEISDQVSLDVVGPPAFKKGQALGLRFASPGPFSSRIRVDYLDVRERGTVPGIGIESDRNVTLSLLQPTLVEQFNPLSWLATYQGDTLELNEFLSTSFSKFEVLALNKSHMLLRSRHPLDPGDLVGLVYKGKYETKAAD